jgi:RND family efflux transporter MFP subunit
MVSFVSKIFLYSFIFTTFLYSSNMNARAIIVSLDRTTLSSEIAGKIINLDKQDGESFKRGELLVKIECDLYQAQKDKVKIEQDIALQEYNNYKKLEKLKSTSKIEIAKAKAKYQKEQTELKIAKLNVKRCSIYAPFDGRVVSKKANRYQIVKPQDELLDIVNTNHLEAVAVVPAIWLKQLKKNQQVIVDIDEIGESVHAYIKEFGAVVDASSQTIDVRLKLQTKYKNILSGMSATVYFNIK